MRIAGTRNLSVREVELNPGSFVGRGIDEQPQTTGTPAAKQSTPATTVLTTARTTRRGTTRKTSKPRVLDAATGPRRARRCTRATSIGFLSHEPNTRFERGFMASQRPRRLLAADRAQPRKRGARPKRPIPAGSKCRARVRAALHAAKHGLRAHGFESRSRRRSRPPRRRTPYACRWPRHSPGAGTRGGRVSWRAAPCPDHDRIASRSARVSSRSALPAPSKSASASARLRSCSASTFSSTVSRATRR